MEDTTALFEEYEKLKAVVKEAEDKIDELKPKIIELIPEGKDVDGQAGVFSVQSRATWKYSKNHGVKKAELKEIEESEKAKGIATAEYAPVLYYKPTKVENGND